MRISFKVVSSLLSEANYFILEIFLLNSTCAISSHGNVKNEKPFAVMARPEPVGPGSNLGPK